MLLNHISEYIHEKNTKFSIQVLCYSSFCHLRLRAGGQEYSGIDLPERQITIGRKTTYRVLNKALPALAQRFGLKKNFLAFAPLPPGRWEGRGNAPLCLQTPNSVSITLKTLKVVFVQAPVFSFLFKQISS